MDGPEVVVSPAPIRRSGLVGNWVTVIHAASFIPFRANQPPYGKSANSGMPVNETALKIVEAAAVRGIGLIAQCSSENSSWATELVVFFADFSINRKTPRDRIQGQTEQQNRNKE